MNPSTPDFQGLRPEQITESRTKNGSNLLYVRPKRRLWHMLKDVATEPMFLLLVVACALYFSIGDASEAWLMVGAVIFVTLIEIVQEFRSEQALSALGQMAQPRVTVIRSGKRQEVPVEDVVVGDLIAFVEGERIAADGLLQQANDLSVDEAILTGESLPVVKSTEEGQNIMYQGATVASGAGIAVVQAVGVRTEFGKLGKSIEMIETDPTPLQRQINRFVQQMLWAGLLAFIVVYGINYFYSGSLLGALLYSLAFAMALVPEEIPVAFTTFMALGAYRMTRRHVLVKQPKTVESLGAATVICLDKTGTITENKMTVAEIVDYSGHERTLEYAMWASEPIPFDAMEKAIHLAYQQDTSADLRPTAKMVHEYPLGGLPPMMTHVFERKGADQQIIAAKGAVERILAVCKADVAQQALVLEKATEMARKGYRILGVASAVRPEAGYPEQQDDFPWVLEGLVGLYDPPKAHIDRVMNDFYRAGIAVKMITGDYAETALNIARESGIRMTGAAAVSGETVMKMTDQELQDIVGKTVVFARMFPDAKLRVVEALKANGEIVAMTGDGVNDGPALKSAQVGVAMGHRGTEIAKSAASMVLLDDNLAHMVNAIKTGRLIYYNLRKAIRYIISIHLPIVLVVLFPLLFGWTYLHMLTPIHVIFLELIMGPTCAIAFENEPAEPNVLQLPPRTNAVNLFSWPELSLSLLQGFIITLGVLAMYHYAIWLGKDETTTRSFVFITMLLANIFLTLANRSFQYTIVKTIFYRNALLWWMIGVSLVLIAVIVWIPIVRKIFELGPLTLRELGVCLLAALVSVGWFEIWKWIKNKRTT